MVYEQTIVVPVEEAAIINRHLTDSAFPQGKDAVISKTAVFPDNMEVEVKCCGCENDLSWAEAVLFNCGCETHCELGNAEFFGDWTFAYGDCHYIVHVVMEKTV